MNAKYEYVVRHLCNKQYSYILVKAPPRVQYGKIAHGRGRETNIARGEAECYIRLETKPKCYFFHIARAGVL